MIRFGFKMQKDDCLRELDEVVKEFSSNYEQHFDKLLMRIPSHYYEGVNPAVLIAAAVAGYHETKIRDLSAHEDVVEVLKLLHRYSDLKLGIITNGITVKQAEKVVRLDIYQYLDSDAIFISDQMGMNKPNIKLFLRACRKIGVRPPETMYIGDHPKMDIDPPNKIGMITVHSKRGGKHVNEPAQSSPDYVIHNFWDLLEIIEDRFGIDIEGARRLERETRNQARSAQEALTHGRSNRLARRQNHCRCRPFAKPCPRLEHGQPLPSARRLPRDSSQTGRRTHPWRKRVS